MKPALGTSRGARREIGKNVHSHREWFSHLSSVGAAGHQREIAQAAVRPKHGRARLQMPSTRQHIVHEHVAQSTFRKHSDDAELVE
jgi:hypothetical protein